MHGFWDAASLKCSIVNAVVKVKGLVDGTWMELAETQPPQPS